MLAANWVQLIVFIMVFVATHPLAAEPSRVQEIQARAKELREKIGSGQNKPEGVGRPSPGSQEYKAESGGPKKIYEGDAGIPLKPVDEKSLVLPKGRELLSSRGEIAPPATSVKDRLQFKDIPDCPGSDKREEAINQGARGSSDSVYSDTLFIKNGKLPEDWKMMIGEGVGALEVGGAQTPYASQYANAFNVPCLPYRIRVLGDRVVYLEGNDALRNFDKGSKGKLHEFFKEKR